MGIIVIRDGRREDAEPLSAVARAAKSLWGYPASWLEAWRGELTLTAQDVERLHLRVAEEDGVLVGFGAVDTLETGEWELAHLWVHPSHGRRGVGRQLLSVLATVASDAGATRLRIDADPHAVPFYQREGAIRIGDVSAPMPGAPQRVLIRMELRLPR